MTRVSLSSICRVVPCSGALQLRQKAEDDYLRALQLLAMEAWTEQ